MGLCGCKHGAPPAGKSSGAAQWQVRAKRRESVGWVPGGACRAVAALPQAIETAMKAFGINRKVNAKGDTLVSYHKNRPKYPFVYVSIRGARWKQSAEQARKRFA